MKVRVAPLLLPFSSLHARTRPPTTSIHRVGSLRMASGTRGGWGSHTMDPGEAQGDRQFAPSADRNKAAILAQLSAVFDESQRRMCLEIASGTGQHVAHFAEGLPHVTWIPSDLTDEAFPSIRSWCAELPNVEPALVIDASAEDWAQCLPEASLDAVIVANMCHISPWTATEGLMRGASVLLKPGSGLLSIYGPFTVNNGEFTSESNANFDQSLRERNPEWGYRDVEQMKDLAASLGFGFTAKVDMPANNFMLQFHRVAPSPS